MNHAQMLSFQVKNLLRNKLVPLTPDLSELVLSSKFKDLRRLRIACEVSVSAWVDFLAAHPGLEELDMRRAEGVSIPFENLWHTH